MHTYTSINNTHNKYIQHWRSSSVIFARCRSCLTLAQVVIHLMPPVTPIDHVNKVARKGCLVASLLSLSFPEVDLSRWREVSSLRVGGTILARSEVHDAHERRATILAYTKDHGVDTRRETPHTTRWTRG